MLRKKYVLLSPFQTRRHLPTQILPNNLFLYVIYTDSGNGECRLSIGLFTHFKNKSQ